MDGWLDVEMGGEMGVKRKECHNGFVWTILWLEVENDGIPGGMSSKWTVGKDKVGHWVAFGHTMILEFELGR